MGWLAARPLQRLLAYAGRGRDGRHARRQRRQRRPVPLGQLPGEDENSRPWLPLEQEPGCRLRRRHSLGHGGRGDRRGRRLAFSPGPRLLALGDAPWRPRSFPCRCRAGGHRRRYRGRRAGQRRRRRGRVEPGRGGPGGGVEEAAGLGGGLAFQGGHRATLSWQGPAGPEGLWQGPDETFARHPPSSCATAQRRRLGCRERRLGRPLSQPPPTWWQGREGGGAGRGRGRGGAGFAGCCRGAGLGAGAAEEAVVGEGGTAPRPYHRALGVRAGPRRAAAAGRRGFRD
mmetsp:Transcript_51602/g.167597  ORF Transcript_51602/g.167597 Transcript_51602/m.167597 type:complete len:286 (+) Transcript_51602:1340-2197(+)